MNWGSWDAFFFMGGYGLYVWGSYAVTLIAIALEVVLVVHRRAGALAGVRATAAERTESNDEAAS